MSLYEPKTAESNEAFQPIPNHTDPSQNAKDQPTAEVILRLPDLDQIDAEFEEIIDAAECEPQEDQETLDQDTLLESPEDETDKASRFAAFSPTKWQSWLSSSKQRSDNDRLRKIINIVVMLLLAGLLGFGVARITDGLGFYGDNSPKVTNDCPAPDAPTAPLYKPPQYASSEKSPTKKTPKNQLSVNVATPQLDMTASKPSQASFAPTDYQPNQSKNEIVRIAPTTVHASWSKNARQDPHSRTSIPVGPNLQQNQVFTPSTTYQENSTAPGNQPVADRFSPERIQQVLRSPGSVQTMRYPETQPTRPNHSSASVNYQPIQVPAAAQYPAPQMQPNYSPQAYQKLPPSPAPPISPYPPAGVYRTPSGHTAQNWPAERTYVPPSTPQPYRQPGYPPNGYGYPASNTIAQPPVDPSVYR